MLTGHHVVAVAALVVTASAPVGAGLAYLRRPRVHDRLASAREALSPGHEPDGARVPDHRARRAGDRRPPAPGDADGAVPDRPHRVLHRDRRLPLLPVA